jgi:F0F1-type ATP synthase membrane subunit a
MTNVNEYPLRRLGQTDGWRLYRNLLGGALILAVWLALWTWFAAGVVRPVSSASRLAAERAAAAERI